MNRTGSANLGCSRLDKSSTSYLESCHISQDFLVVYSSVRWQLQSVDNRLQLVRVNGGVLWIIFTTPLQYWTAIQTWGIFVTTSCSPLDWVSRLNDIGKVIICASSKNLTCERWLQLHSFQEYTTWRSALVDMFVKIQYQQDGRLPPANFPHSHFGKDAFLKEENVSVSKCYVPSS